MLSMQHIPLTNERNVCLVTELALKDQLTLVLGE